MGHIFFFLPSKEWCSKPISLRVTFNLQELKLILASSFFPLEAPTRKTYLSRRYTFLHGKVG